MRKTGKIIEHLRKEITELKREKSDFSFFSLREEMNRAKYLLGGLFAINDLEFFVGIYDDETKKLKLINNLDNKPKVHIFIHDLNDGHIKMGIQIKFKESDIITTEEDEKRYEENKIKHSTNPLTS